MMTSNVLNCLLLLATTSQAFVPLHTSSTATFTRSTSPVQPLHLFFGNRRTHNEARQQLEFDNLEPLTESHTRRERLQRDRDIQDRFEAFGDSLWDLRSEMEELSSQLLQAMMHTHSKEEEMNTRQKLREAERRDPELAYKLALAEVEMAQAQGLDATEHVAAAQEARSCLPQFQLEGLWVGKYGRSYDLINITYAGDTLIAEKVTGDNNVPQGALSFQVDLNPLKRSSSRSTQQRRASHQNSASIGDEGSTSGGSSSLAPITLTQKAAQKWGTRKLPRYAGLGQVAEEGYKNAQWIDGQLIIIGNDYFSFAWLPIEQQIFFGRPSPELALKMLRDSGVTRVPTEFAAPPTDEDDLATQKDFAWRCLEKTHDCEDEGMAGSALWQNDGEECYFE